MRSTGVKALCYVPSRGSTGAAESLSVPPQQQQSGSAPLHHLALLRVGETGLLPVRVSAGGGHGHSVLCRGNSRCQEDPSGIEQALNHTPFIP